MAERHLAVSANSFNVADRHGGVALWLCVLRGGWIRHDEETTAWDL